MRCPTEGLTKRFDKSEGFSPSTATAAAAAGSATTTTAAATTTSYD